MIQGYIKTRLRNYVTENEASSSNNEDSYIGDSEWAESRDTFYCITNSSGTKQSYARSFMKEIEEDKRLASGCSHKTAEKNIAYASELG